MVVFLEILQINEVAMKNNKKAGFFMKFLFISFILFVFVVILIKYPVEGKIIVGKLYRGFVLLLDLLIEAIGWAIKQLAKK